MKKLFQHGKKKYEELSYEWDEKSNDDSDVIEYLTDEEIDEEAEYYADDMEERHSMEERQSEEIEEEYYYADSDSEEEEGYYADSDSEEEEGYYADSDSEEEEYYYANSESEEEEGYYADSDSEEEEYYYADNDSEEEEYYSADRDITANRNRKKRIDNSSGNFFSKILKRFLGMGNMDRAIIATGAAVLVLAIITGGIYASAKAVDKQVSGFAEVGRQLDGIRLIGEEGLLAVANAQMARAAVSNVVEVVYEPEQTVYEEEDYSKKITIALSMASIQKDLKIKFINKETNKLVSNVPFSVTITDPDGKTSVWTDDDKDGIIYKKDIVPGKYAVLVNGLEDEKYADYILPASAEKVEVKKDIAYEKVDVSDEIKTESEINVSKEDTKINDTQVESYLKDTVAWVESTAVAVMYVEVQKSTIPDPAALDMTDDSLLLSHTGNISESSRTLIVGESFQLTASVGTAVPDIIVWSSNNTSVATVDQGGKVTAVAKGTALITYTANTSTVSDNEVIASETVTGGCIVRVKPDYTKDVTTPLKDTGGNELYVAENGVYRAAVYADYYKLDKFFVKGDAKYTGWQTLDGKVFFFDKDGNKVTGEQVIQGAKYNFASDGSLVMGSGSMGIDVSKWNGNIDWNAVKNSGISYVIIRCGYRGSSQGSLVVDPKFHTYIKGATAAGLKVGVYFFTQAIDEREAVEEASMVLELVKSYKISYPVFLDVESSGGRADSISKETRTAVCKAFCQTIKSAGYTAGIYANKNWLTTKIDAGQLSAYKIWLAQYASAPTYTGRYDLWQYKSTGRVSGISGNVDMNISYLGY